MIDSWVSLVFHSMIPCLPLKVEFALESGLEGIWVPHRICGDKSPGHPDFDPFWARLAESGVPFLIHIGGATTTSIRHGLTTVSRFLKMRSMAEKTLEPGLLSAAPCGGAFY